MDFIPDPLVTYSNRTAVINFHQQMHKSIHSAVLYLKPELFLRLYLIRAAKKLPKSHWTLSPQINRRTLSNFPDIIVIQARTPEYLRHHIIQQLNVLADSTPGQLRKLELAAIRAINLEFKLYMKGIKQPKLDLSED